MPVTLSDLLKRMLELGGSDLHLTTNSPPQVRVHGHLQPLDLPPLAPAETKQLAYSVMTDAHLWRRVRGQVEIASTKLQHSLQQIT